MTELNETEQNIVNVVLEVLELKRKRSPRHPPLVN